MQVSTGNRVGTWRSAVIAAVMMTGVPGMAVAQEASASRNWFDSAKSVVVDVMSEGHTNVFLSGYAHHSRDTYADKRVGTLNEQAWGGGLGRTLRNARGNDETLYAMAIRDSNRNIQWTAGYVHQWIYPVGQTGIEAGVGLTAAVISRRDWYGGTPFPAVLPVLSLGPERAKLMATYVPRLSTRKGKGDVLLLFFNVSL